MFLKITIYTEKIINPIKTTLIAIGKSEDSGIKRVVCDKKYHAGKDTEELFMKAEVELKVLKDEVQKYLNQ